MADESLSQEEILAAAFGTGGDSEPGRMGNTGHSAAVKDKIAADIAAQGILLTQRGPFAHSGTTVGFYGVTPAPQPAALTAADTTAFTAADGAVVDATYGAEEAGVIANLRTRLAENEAVTGNLRTRVGELEARLRSLGLLA